MDYTRPAPTFCSGGGGCAALRLTAYAFPFGIPMPVFGLLSYVVQLIVSDGLQSSIPSYYLLTAQ